MSGPQLVVGSHDTARPVTKFLDGSERVVVVLGPTWIGHGTYRPGWRWTEHVQPMHDKDSEPHAGFVLSGELVVRSADGSEALVQEGQGFFVDAGHDAWVRGDAPCVALDFPIPRGEF